MHLYNKIIDYLLSNITRETDGYDAQFKHWVMSKRFNLIEISDKMVLYRTVETQLKYLKI